MKKGLLFFALLFASFQVALAQSMQVSGKVTDAGNGESIVGATISVDGTKTVVLSKVDGTYSITVPSSSSKVLVVSFTGMKDARADVTSNNQVIDFKLEPDATDIGGIIVTGYGNVSKKEYTGSAASVKSDRTKDVPSVSLEDRLAGSISGVQITNSSGAPGNVASVRIRGMGSINAGNEPLYVIDGVPVLSGDVNGLKVTQAETDNSNSLLSTINPSDIESMTVIKDAAAASLYGSRAANGVIVITTKKGVAGKVKFNVKANAGISDMAVDYRPVLGGDARKEVLTLGLFNYARYVGEYTEEASWAYANANIGDFATKPWSGWTDWSKELLRTGVNQNYEVSASGGNEKTRFYTSLSYTDVKGISKVSDYNRITGRVNVSHRNGNFSLDANSMISSVNQTYNEEDTGYASPLFMSKGLLSPADYPYNPDGSFNLTEGFKGIGGKGASANPSYSNALNSSTSQIFRAYNTISAQYEFIKGLTLKEVLAYDYTQSHNVVWWDPRTGNGSAFGGLNQTVDNNFATLTSQTQLGYNNTFGKHTVGALVSFEAEQNTQRMLYGMGQGYANPTMPEIGNASETDASGSQAAEGLISWVARADYNYAGRYYVGASFRRDGTSRLAPQSRWGNFWSVSGAWRMANEEWWKNGGIGKVVTDAKVRASYGVNGTRPNSFYGYMGLYGYGYNYNGSSGSVETSVPNPNLRWEQNLATNVGIDLTFIDRINLSVDWYSRDTKDLIMPLSISQTTGFASTLQNVGSMRNTGVEAEISARIFDKKDLSWTVGFNISHNKNTLLTYDGVSSQQVDGRWIHKVGNPYYSFYLLKSAGVDSETGAEKYYVNPDKGDYSTTIDGAKAQKTIVGKWEPDVQGGLSSNFRWKFIDFNFTFTYSIGGSAVNTNANQTVDGSGWSYYGQVPASMDIDKMWKKPGDIAELPMFMYDKTVYTSDRFMMSTDHLRLKNLTIGFTAPKKWFGRSGVESIRIYASGNNVFTIKDPKCIVDPETAVGGIAGFRTPQLRTWTFGIEINF